MVRSSYTARVLRLKILGDLVGAPWEQTRLRELAKELHQPALRRLAPEALNLALRQRAAAVPPDRAERSIPASRLRHPWMQWWRKVLLHRAHPRHFPLPADGAFVEIAFASTQEDCWMPPPFVFTQERRFIVSALQEMLPDGELDIEIKRRLAQPSWNQIIPREMLWELHPSHIRKRSFRMRLMLPAHYVEGLKPEETFTVSPQLMF